jgi:hypothetical protein
VKPRHFPPDEGGTGKWQVAERERQGVTAQADMEKPGFKAGLSMRR